ncbi:MAG TPA: YggS family pyridoxal phosphate-dependent enzyme, partial [Labilithrix sp.]
IVARAASLVHTVDSPALAKELAKRAAKERTEPLPVLVEVNVGGETNKHGATPGEIGAVIEAVALEPSLALRGLMTMPPHDVLAARRAFEALVSLRNLHGGRTRLPELSMGMSDDLEVAIACGATMVRVGTAIFGARG